MRYREWAAFGLLGLIWGSSFLWIKLAVDDISPSLLVSLRLGFGLLALLAVAAARRSTVDWPRSRGRWGQYLFLGIVNTALPIFLISWSEVYIASGLAAILNATVPLFTLLVAHWWLHDEKITRPRLLGLAFGFAGVLVVVVPGLVGEQVKADVVGQLAVLLAAACYAVGSTYSRRNMRGASPLTVSVLVLLTSGAVSWLYLFTTERPVLWPTQPLTWVAALWLGVLGSGVAYLLYFYLISAWGVTRTSLVTYILPVIGLFLGARFLHETIGWNMLAGLALILAGIALVNRAR